jgi:hypothetical protein
MAAVVVLPPSGTKAAGAADEHMEVDTPSSAAAAPEEDLYTRLKTLQRQLEFLEIQVRGYGTSWVDSSACGTCHAVFVLMASKDSGSGCGELTL